MRGTLMGPTFFGTFSSQNYGKNSAASKQKQVFWEIDKNRFYGVKVSFFLSKIENTQIYFKLRLKQEFKRYEKIVRILSNILAVSGRNGIGISWL